MWGWRCSADAMMRYYDGWLHMMSVWPRMSSAQRIALLQSRLKPVSPEVLDASGSCRNWGIALGMDIILAAEEFLPVVLLIELKRLSIDVCLVSQIPTTPRFCALLSHVSITCVHNKSEGHNPVLTSDHLI